ncbi:Lysophosphatidylcholine acyltransferase 2 [Tritrichomonas musculus]|uniref:Lysophosphatidylcholine acyltransferase 2 n=1 Tax=Tritrichomonas musculus TaxID=1915356 RepID=A0ABR2H8B5_9EUKA
MPLYTQVPIDDPKLHNQTKLTSITKKEYEDYFLPHPSNMFYDVIRVILFIVTLGPIRMLISLLCIVALYVTMIILNRFFKHHFKSMNDYKRFSQKALYPIVRLLLFSIGIIHIKRKGEIKSTTRTIIINHLTLFDIMVAVTMFDSSYLAMASLKHIGFMKEANDIFNMVFVDRSKPGQGTTETIRKIQGDPSTVPIVIFPEGKVTNGDILLGFRTGGFISDTPLQAITLRYNHWFCPKGLSTIAWVHPSDLFYIWQVYTIPFMTLEINILPQVCFEDKTPEDKAREVELMMANSLGCLAVKQTNKEYFKEHISS